MVYIKNRRAYTASRMVLLINTREIKKSSTTKIKINSEIFLTLLLMDSTSDF
jgi:hypothetical protein